MNRQPQVQVTPASVCSGEVAEYEIRITNIDDTACAPTIFGVRPAYSHSFYVDFPGPRSIELAPGETGIIDAEMGSEYATPVAPMPPGTYEHEFNVLSAAHDPVDSIFYYQVMDCPESSEVNDLEVTFIGRTPRYPRYIISYPEKVVYDDFTPYFISYGVLAGGQTSETKRWPDENETVTFTANVLNRGSQSVTQFSYTWTVDGAEVENGVWTGNVEPGEVAEVSLPRQWDDNQHTIGFTATMPNDITPENNSVEDYTKALALATFIEESYAQAWRENTADYPNCTTDILTQWLRKHIKKLNDMFEAAGSAERVRYDHLEIVPDGTIPKQLYDLSGFDGFWPNVEPYIFNPGRDDQRRNAYYDNNEDIDYAMLHEVCHQLGIIDIYQLNLEPEENLVTGERYTANQGLMNSVMHYINPHTAQALNHWQGKRRGYYGQYLYNVPAQNELLVLDADGEPISGATIRIYQKVLSPEKKPVMPNIVKFEGMTDSDGIYAIPNVPIDESLYPTTETDDVLRPNPFGYISCVGLNGTFLIEISKNELVAYEWLDIMAFNLAYWQGNTERATYTVNVED